MAPKITAVEQIPRRRIQKPGLRLQVFAAVITLLESLSYVGDQEFVWRRIGEWKGWK